MSTAQQKNYTAQATVCNCKEITEATISEKAGIEGKIVDFEFFSGKTFSRFEYKDGRRSKTLMILHTYCPFCGQKYEKGETK